MIALFDFIFSIYKLLLDLIGLERRGSKPTM